MRISKEVNGEKTRHVWDGTNIYAELDGNGNVKEQYTRGIRLIKNSKDVYYTYNGHGDVTALTDWSGNVTRKYEFDAFGVEKNKDDNETNPFRYCGEYYDRETDTVYLRARYYNPGSGRFTSEDPHWNVNNMIYGDERNSYPNINVIIQSGNLYGYCGNNPIMFIDRSGKSFGDIINNMLDLNNQMAEQDLSRKDMISQAEKEQKKIWKLGAEYYLRRVKGYYTSAWLLEHSLEDNPSDVYRGDDSRIAQLIKNDPAFKEEFQKAISSGKDSGYFYVTFEGGDLYYSIHSCTINYQKVIQSDGSIIIKMKMTDKYDYTEVTTFMDKNKYAWKASLGTVANDAAVVSQNANIIKPYNITVEFVVKL